MLRAQFIRGLCDPEIREKILQQAELSFNDTLQVALAIEASKIENKEIYKSISTPSYINKISTSNDFRSRLRSRSATRKNQNKQRFSSENRGFKNNKIKDLGLDGLCLHCAKSNHKSNECRIKHKLKCDKCHKKYHIAKVCITSLLRQKSNKRENVNTVENEELCDYDINRIIDVFTTTVHDDRIFAEVKLNGKICRFECDLGSRVSLMNVDEFNKLNINAPIQKTNLFFRSYTGEICKPLGMVKIDVSYQGRSSYEELYIVPLQKDALLGRTLIRNLKINLNDHNQTKIISKHPTENLINTTISKIKENFSDVFKQEVGQIPGYICSLKLRENAKPVFIKSRPVPYALKEEVDRELEKLEQQGIIEKTDYSEWGTPLVVVPKSDGTVRLCADFKVTVNKQLHEARHPIPRIEDIFNKLRNGSYFCTLDMYKAYLHLKVDDESSKIQTISTHRGTYLAKRLFFGIKSAPNEFHKFIDQFVQNLDGVIAYFDDIIIQGNSFEECKSRLTKVLEKLRENNMHVNINKCKFFERKIQYLGHVISCEGLQKSPEKVKAIQEAPRPKSVDEVRQFLGMIMYYSKFITHASTLLHPLNQLLRKNVKFKWTAECEAAFIRAKIELSSDNILVPFNPELPVILATDASPVGLSGILSHQMTDGSERPIAYASRSLTVAEKNYSQLDKEATAVFWATKKFYDYLFGRKFTLVVDNKPMMMILHPEKKLPVLSATRMLRYAQFMSNFDYNIVHRKSTEHANADYLSRNPLPISSQEVNRVDGEYLFHQSVVQHISSLTITDKVIRKETEQDKELSKLSKEVIDGTVRDTEITIQDGILFRGQRVIIPKILQPSILQELHSTHVGIVRMKALARNYCYWHNIDADIENIVKSCRDCCEIKKNPKKAPIHNWEKPTKNWQRVHMDYAGPIMDHHFFIVVDAKSKWPEIYPMRKAPDSSVTIHYLREIFSRYGLPEILVSDNASIFKSKEFQDFCTRNGIRQRLIAPGHPATNGQAERYCQTFKAKLKCMKNEQGTLHEKLHQILFRYRATPLSDGKTPAEKLFGQNIRTKLDLIKPSQNQKNTATQPNFNKSFRVGDRIQSRNYIGSRIWKYGTVVERLGNVHYLIELDDGYILKRHFDQLRLCQVEKEIQSTPSLSWTPRKSVRFNDHINLPSQRYNRFVQTDSTIPAAAPGPDLLPTAPAPSTQPDSSNQRRTQARTTGMTVQSPALGLRRSTRVKKPIERLQL